MQEWESEFDCQHPHIKWAWWHVSLQSQWWGGRQDFQGLLATSIAYLTKVLGSVRNSFSKRKTFSVDHWTHTHPSLLNNPSAYIPTTPCLSSNTAAKRKVLFPGIHSLPSTTAGTQHLLQFGCGLNMHYHPSKGLNVLKLNQSPLLRYSPSLWGNNWLWCLEVRHLQVY